MSHSDLFEFIYHPDGTCHIWDCGRLGAVLAYDDMSPEHANWFCRKCWDWFEGEHSLILRIAMDRRYIAPPDQLPQWAESIWDGIKMIVPEVKSGPEIRIWATSTDLKGMEHERRKYYVILEDGGVETKLILEVHADRTLVAVPYVVADYNYDDYDDDGYEDYDEDDYVTEEDWDEDDDYDGVIYY